MFISVYFRCCCSCFCCRPCCHRRWKEMPGLDNKPQLSAMGLTTGSVSPWRIRRDWRACCAHINLYGLLCTYTYLSRFCPTCFFTINHHLRPISWLIFKREFPEHSCKKISVPRGDSWMGLDCNWHTQQVVGTCLMLWLHEFKGRRTPNANVMSRHIKSI